MSTTAKTGILLTNLGTPSAPSPAAVRKYLREFLSDPRVIDLPRFLWLPILYGLILPFRSKKSAHLYKKIWLPEGSPLLVNSKKLCSALQQRLQESSPVEVELGMRYGKPSLAEALTKLQEKKVQNLLILPLYPQYSATTTASTFDVIVQVLKKPFMKLLDQEFLKNPKFSASSGCKTVQLISHYHNEPSYIAAWENHIQKFYSRESNSYLLFSFHGLPERYVSAGDPYQEQCRTTANLIAEKLKLAPEQWGIAFQSRFGKAKWIQPYCNETLINLAQQGKTDVTVVCPGFAVDCLETLEEIAMQNREIFLKSGGKYFTYIPALNDSDLHVDLLTAVITKSAALSQL